MDAEPVGVWVVTLQGVEAPGGGRLTVLAFVRAQDEAQAQAGATGELRALGWREVEALRAGEVIDSAALPEDFRGAFQTALTYGCGLIIYDED